MNWREWLGLLAGLFLWAAMGTCAYSAVRRVTQLEYQCATVARAECAGGGGCRPAECRVELTNGKRLTRPAPIMQGDEACWLE